MTRSLPAVEQPTIKVVRNFGFRWRHWLTVGALLTGCGGDGLGVEDNEAGSGGDGSGTGGDGSGTGGNVPAAGGANSGGAFGVGGNTGGAVWGTGGQATGGNAASGGSSTGGATSSGGATSTGGGTSTGGASSESHVQVYLLFGQSNMWGVPPVEAQDKTTNPKVEVMALTACSGQTVDGWKPAAPPLHGCIGQGSGNPGLGPGDYFAKKIAAAYPNDTILLVPNAIPGVSIDVFAKGQTAYASIVARAKKAQQRGEIRGMIFHQGESDSSSGSGTWVARVKAVVENLRADLGTGNVPFLAGELPYTGCCGTGFNPTIAKLPASITNAHVVSASGLAILGDNLHFNSAAQRTFGGRYGDLMLTLLDP